MSGDAAWWEQTCNYWHDQADEARRFRDLAALQAKQAEAERDALRAQVERVRALVDRWDEPYVPYGATHHASELRAALDGPP